MIQEGEDMFNPQSFEKQSDSLYKKPRNRRNSRNGGWGKWSSEESLKYVIFMEAHQDIFNSRQKRRISRIFKEMSKYIPTRTPIQCRSHHQKLLVKYKNFRKIIQAFKVQIGDDLYKLKFQQFMKSYKSIEDFSSSTPQKSNEEEEQPQFKDVETQTEAVLVIDGQQQKQFMEKALSLNPLLLAMLTCMTMLPSN